MVKQSTSRQSRKPAPRADYSRVDQTRATAHTQGSMPGMARLHVVSPDKFVTLDGMARRTTYTRKAGKWSWLEVGVKGFRMAGKVGNPARLEATLARRLS